MPDRGPRGPEGEPGQDGKPGPEGPQGPAGRDGVDGAPGPQGPQGKPGPEGPQGPAGRDGVDGAPGPAGADGALGARGPIGPRGYNGVEGVQGPMGPMPDHQWDGTRLRFEEPDGSWGKYTDLQGPRGQTGANGGGGGGGSSLLALQVQTLLAIFGGWIADAPTVSISSLTAVDLQVSGVAIATGFYSSVPGGAPVDAAYEWDWGDGSTSSTLSADHTYAAEGTYSVGFRAKNHIGWSDPVVQDVTVSAAPTGIEWLSTGSLFHIAGGSSDVITFGDSPPAGSSVFVTMSAYTSDGEDPSIMDTQGNEYAKIEATGTLGDNSAMLFACFSIAGGDDLEVTVSAAGGSYITGSAAAFTPCTAKDASGVATPDADAPTGRSVTTTAATVQADELSISVYAFNGVASTPIVDLECDGFTQIYLQADPSDFQPGSGAYRIETSVGFKTADWAHASLPGNHANTFIATFKGI
jgi:PKD repeat protein